jgi:hypothetical protein
MIDTVLAIETGLLVGSVLSLLLSLLIAQPIDPWQCMV